MDPDLGVKCLIIELEVRGFDSQHFDNFKCGLGLQRDPPNLLRKNGFRKTKFKSNCRNKYLNVFTFSA